MMKNRVILLTRRFPFFKTEAFLESEIVFLADSFDEIIIVPTEVSSEVRELPSNVKIDRDFSAYFQNKSQRIIRTIFSSFFWNTLWKYKNFFIGLGYVKHILQFCSSVLVYKAYFKEFPFSDRDLVYTYWFSEATKALCDLKSKNDLAIISRAHRYDIYEGLPSTPLFWPYRKEILENIDCVFSISEDGKMYMEDKYRVFGKIQISKLGVFDRDLLSPISKDELVSFVSVSRINPMKRVQFIADFVCAYARQNPYKNVVWTHFGDGDDRSNVKKSIPLLPNLQVNIDGAVSNTDIYKYYSCNSVSIFINLSSSEGIPVSIMEAQSFGIPVIATDVGGTSEIVSSKTGKLLPSNPSITEVIDATDEVLKRRFTRTQIKEVWNENFNAEVNYQMFVNILKTKNFNEK